MPIEYKAQVGEKQKEIKMQKGIEIQELARRLQETESQKQDFIVATEALKMHNTFPLNLPRPMLSINGQGEFLINENAHRQIAEKLQIPHNYYRRMLETEPNLLAENVNTWLQAQPEKRMIRTLNKPEGRIVRAFVSDRFTTTRDNKVVAEAILPVLLEERERNNLSIKSCELTEKRMYLQCVYPQMQAVVKVGDVVQGGIVISNSEIGLGAFQIELLLYRLVCMNGMIRPASIRKHHVGRRIDTDEEVNQDFYTRETLLADQHAFQLKITDTVRHSFNKDAFDGEILKLQEASSDIFKARKADNLVEEIVKKYALTEDEGGSILDALADGKDWSRWGLANAVTCQSHTAASYDRSIEFERLGGKIIDLPTSEWKAMLN